jgi:hypothetical protein
MTIPVNRTILPFNSIMSATTTTTTQTQEQPPLVLRQNAEAGPNLNEYDEEQARLMEERCILVTPEDVAYGEDSKKTCTLLPCVPREELMYRPLDDKHQQRVITSCILRIPLQTIRRKTPTPEKGGRENHFPKYVDEYMLFPSIKYQGGTSRGEPSW